LLNFTTPGLLPKKEEKFKSEYQKAIVAARAKDASQYTIKEGERANKGLQELIKPYILKRGIEGHLDRELPPMEQFLVAVEISETQRKLASEYGRSDIADKIISGEMKSPLQALQHLRKICMHPLLVKQNENKSVRELLAEANTKELVEQGPKLSVMLHLVWDFQAKGDRALLFSQSTKMLDIIELVLHENGVRYVRLDGSTSTRKRQSKVDQFNNDSGIPIMLLSTKAGGLGLNVTGANRVLVFDPDWTPAWDCQV